MNRLTGYTCALLVSAALPSPAAAQTAPAQPERFATEVVVTAERAETPVNQVPASVVVVGKDALQALPVAQPAELLSFLPGFNLMQGQFHAGRPVTSARGFFGGGEAEYVRLLVDGRPATPSRASSTGRWCRWPASSASRRIAALARPSTAIAPWVA